MYRLLNIHYHWIVLSLIFFINLWKSFMLTKAAFIWSKNSEYSEIVLQFKLTVIIIYFKM